jgi:hypothetical protein
LDDNGDSGRLIDAAGHTDRGSGAHLDVYPYSDTDSNKDTHPHTDNPGSHEHRRADLCRDCHDLGDSCPNGDARHSGSHSRSRLRCDRE